MCSHVQGQVVYLVMSLVDIFSAANFLGFCLVGPQLHQSTRRYRNGGPLKHLKKQGNGLILQSPVQACEGLPDMHEVLGSQ